MMLTVPRLKSLFLSACLLILHVQSIFALTVRIYNDSPFVLNAQVLLADGTNTGSVSIAPQSVAHWQQEYGNAKWSLTPLTIVFVCPNGTQYGVASNVQAGATITAQSSNGKRFCQKPKNQKPQDKKKAPPGALELDPIWGPP